MTVFINKKLFTDIRTSYNNLYLSKITQNVIREKKIYIHVIIEKENMFTLTTSTMLIQIKEKKRTFSFVKGIFFDFINDSFTLKENDY